MTDLYFFILTAINLFVLVFMCVLVQLSETLNPKQTRGFLFTFILIGGISILEMISVLVDDGPVWLRAVNILSNYLGFGLTPAVPLCLVYTMERSEHMKGSLRVAIGIEVFYFVVLTVSLFSKGLVFSVDAANHYSREAGFRVYMLGLPIFYSIHWRWRRTFRTVEENWSTHLPDFLRLEHWYRF